MVPDRLILSKLNVVISECGAKKVMEINRWSRVDKMLAMVVVEKKRCWSCWW